MKKIKKVTLFLLILSLFSPLNIFAAKKNFNNSSGKEYKDEINKWKIERFGYKITREPGEEKNGLVNTYIDANYYVNSDSTVTGIKFDGEYKNGSSATFKDVPLRENTYRSASGTIYYKERVERVRFSPWGGYYTYTTWQNKSTSFNVLLPKSFSKPKMSWDKERYNEDKRADILAELQNFTGQLSSVKAYTENVFGVFKGNKDEDLSSKGDYVRFKEVEIEYDKKIDGKATFVASGYAPYIVKHENPKAIKVLAVKSNISQSSRDANDDIFHHITTTLESGKNYDKKDLPLYSIQPKQYLEGAGIERKEYEKIYDSLEKEEQYKKIDEWKLKKTFGHGVDSQASNSIKLNYDAQEAYWIFNRLPMPEKDTIFYIRQKNDKGEYARRQEEKTMKVSEKKNMKIEARYEKEKGIINRFNVYFSNVPPNSKTSYNYNSSQSAKDEVLADKVGKIRIPFYLENDPKSVTFSFKNQYYNDYSITIDFPGGLSKERRDAIRKVSNSDRALSYNEKNKYYEQIDNSKTASEINSINNTIDSRKEAFRESSESEILKNRKEDLISFIEESRFLSNEKKADFKEKVEETSTVTELYSLEDSITKYIFDLTKEKVREEILKLFDYPSKDIDINSISRMYTTKSLEKHLDNATKASKQALFQFKIEKMELNKKIYDSEFSELEKNKLYSTLNNIETQEELNKFKEELEKQIELLNKDVKSYKEQAKKLIDENKILSKEDKEYYYKRLERAKTNVEVKNIIDEISNGGAEALSVLKDKKAEAKKELDKLELRKNSKEYYIRLIDSAISLNEVDEVLKLAKSNFDGSKILLEEKEIARNKLKEINNLTEKDNEKFTEDIYYAMEVRELDDILKLANIKATENLEKSKTLAKMKIYKLTNLPKEDSEKLMKDIDSAKFIEDVNKILKESEELDVKKKLEKDKEELVEKLKDLKYLTNEKLTSYSKDIKEAETYELAKTIYNKAVEENTKAEELEKEKETYANKLKEKKEEALKIIKGKNLSEYKLNYFTKLIEKASTIEQVETILNNKMLKEDNNSNEGNNSTTEPEKPGIDENIIEPSNPIEEKDFSKDILENLNRDTFINKVKEITENSIVGLDKSNEEKEELKNSLIKIEAISDLDSFMVDNNMDVLPTIKTIAFNTLDDMIKKNPDDKKSKLTYSFSKTKIYKSNSLQEVLDILEKLS